MQYYETKKKFKFVPMDNTLHSDYKGDTKRHFVVGNEISISCYFKMSFDLSAPW